MPVLVFIVGGVLGAVFGRKKPKAAQKMVTVLNDTGLGHLLNVATVTLLPLNHPIAKALKHFG